MENSKIVREVQRAGGECDITVDGEQLQVEKVISEAPSCWNEGVNHVVYVESPRVWGHVDNTRAMTNRISLVGPAGQERSRCRFLRCTILFVHPLQYCIMGKFRPRLRLFESMV